MRHLFLGIFMLAGMAAGGCTPETALLQEPSEEASVRALADAYVEQYFEAFPHEATFAGVKEGPHHRLPDISATARAEWHATEDSILAALQSIDAARLPQGSAAAVTHGFLVNYLRNARSFRTCSMDLWNVSPTWTGWQSVLANLADSQPVGTQEDRDAAVRRFGQLSRYIDQEIENLREGLSQGLTAPKGNVRGVIRQMDALLQAPVEESPFVAMAPDTLDDFRARMETLEEDEIRPAIRRYRAFLEDEYLPQAREEVGVSANPGGPACYRAAIPYYATVGLSPEEVHQTGLTQMQWIRTQMRTIAEESFGSTNLDEVLERLRNDPQYHFESRAHKQQVARGAIRRARAAVPAWFGNVPEADVEVRPVASFQEESAPDGFYSAPAEDGSRPGIYYINLYQAESTPRAGLEATAFHEAYPGHHLQIALAQERASLHPVSRYIYLSGFGEGWALYSERLADEMNLYSSDVDRMGLLSNEAMRAARLVVDSGMHALGWSRQAALDYMRANTVESEANVISEIDRYIAVPGQATSYMLGALEIERLRAMAEEELGERFDVRTFHDRVLEDGSVPLMMLREKIERWVQESK